MAMHVCTGAQMMCTMGAAPAVFEATPRPVQTNNQVAGIITDNIPMLNVPSFGMCESLANPEVAGATAAALGVLTPQPCVPVLPAPWAPGSPTFLITEIPALNNSSKLLCMWAGEISFVTPGQFTEEIP